MTILIIAGTENTRAESALTEILVIFHYFTWFLRYASRQTKMDMWSDDNGTRFFPANTRASLGVIISDHSGVEV